MLLPGRLLRERCKRRVLRHRQAGQKAGDIVGGFSCPCRCRRRKKHYQAERRCSGHGLYCTHSLGTPSDRAARFSGRDVVDKQAGHHDAETRQRLCWAFKHQVGHHEQGHAQKKQRCDRIAPNSVGASQLGLGEAKHDDA